MPFTEYGQIPEPFAGDGQLGGRLYTEMRSAKFEATVAGVPGTGWIIKPSGETQFANVTLSELTLEGEYTRWEVDQFGGIRWTFYEIGNPGVEYDPNGSGFVGPFIEAREDGIGQAFLTLAGPRDLTAGHREAYIQLVYDEINNVGYGVDKTGMYLGTYDADGFIKIGASIAGGPGDSIEINGKIVESKQLTGDIYTIWESVSGDRLYLERYAAGDFMFRNDQQDNGIIIRDGTGGVQVVYGGTIAGSFNTFGLQMEPGQDVWAERFRAGDTSGHTTPGFYFDTDADSGFYSNGDYVGITWGGHWRALWRDSGIIDSSDNSTEGGIMRINTELVRQEHQAGKYRFDSSTGPMGIEWYESGTFMGAWYYRSGPNAISLEDASGNEHILWDADTDDLTLGIGTGADNLNIGARDWNWTNIHWINDSAKGSLRTTNATGTAGASGRIYQHSSSISIKNDLKSISAEESVPKVKLLAEATATYLSPIPSMEEYELYDKDGEFVKRVIVDLPPVEKRSIGFVAEKVQKIEPLTTAEPNEDGYVMTMSEDGIIVHLTVALANALDRIEALEERLAKLENHVLSD